MTVLIGVMIICAVTGIVLAIMVGKLGSALTQPGQAGMQALSFEFAGLKISAGTTLVSLYLLCAACILVVPLYILYQEGPLKDQQVILTGSFAQANPLCVHPEEIVVANRRFYIPIHLALQDQHFLVQASDNSFLSEISTLRPFRKVRSSQYAPTARRFIAEAIPAGIRSISKTPSR
jgi:hypothetical protein